MSAELVVNLDHFAENLRRIRDRVAPASHMLVVKDDAYRHGLEPIVRRAAQEGISWIGALDVETGARVREIVGEDPRIFAWLLYGDVDVAEAIAAKLDCGIGTEELLERIAQAQPQAPVRIHLKIDTGLHRNGVRPESWSRFVRRAKELEDAGTVRVVGVWSHIAEASDEEDDHSRAVFDAAVAEVRAAGLAPEHLHLAASAAAYARSEFRYSMVRIGAFAYGIRATDAEVASTADLRPIATLEADVVEVTTDAFTLNIGQDALSTLYEGHVRVNVSGGMGELCEARGTSSVFSGSGAFVGERVSVFGGSACCSATDIAEQIGTIGEEVLLRVSPLVPRTYVH